MPGLPGHRTAQPIFPPCLRATSKSEVHQSHLVRASKEKARHEAGPKNAERLATPRIVLRMGYSATMPCI